jgi:hypothetical protein
VKKAIIKMFQLFLNYFMLLLEVLLHNPNFFYDLLVIPSFVIQSNIENSTKKNIFSPNGGKNRDFINGSLTEDSGLNPDYITGFTDGDGCFMITINEKTYKNPQIFFTFSISQKYHSQGILKDIKKCLILGVVW